MNTKSAFHPAIFSRTLPFFALIGFLICGYRSEAQSIVGKWQGVSVVNYYTPEYTKVTGKSVVESKAKELGNSTIDYKADHTFIMTFSRPNSTDVTVMKGTWDLNGNNLKSTLEPTYNPTKTSTLSTIAISGNTITVTTMMPPSSKMTKSIATATRM